MIDESTETIPDLKRAMTPKPLVLLRCLRPRQWTKNLLLFAGLVFTAKFTDAAAVLRVVAGFAVFCALAGVAYLLNDLRDVEQDRLHPAKRHRPIACGLISPAEALIYALFLGAAAMTASYYLGLPFALIAAAYFGMNVLYSIWLKHMVIVDIFCIATGFVMRALAGVEILKAMDPKVYITPWFLLCAFFLALFLAICKRRNEVVMVQSNGGGAVTRRVISEYSPALLDQMVSITTTSTILTYGLWAKLGQFQNTHMLYTLPLVVFGVFRYLYLVYKRNEGGEPETLLLSDVPLILCVCAWLVMIVAILFQASHSGSLRVH